MPAYAKNSVGGLRRATGLACTVALLCVPVSSVVWSQSYPNRPVRLLTAEAGGGADLIARLIAQALSSGLGQQVLVDNQGSASGAVAAETVGKARPDGHTLLFYGSNIWILPLLREGVRYDPVGDFAPVMLVDRSPGVLVVNPSLPVKSVRELVALARARPGELNYASGSAGAAPHLAAELFKFLTRTDITRINYRGTAPALNDLIGGQVQLMFPSLSVGMVHVKSGRLRALAVTSRQRSALAPAIPALADSGVPDYEAESTHGLFAPAGTPAAIINLLNGETARMLERPEIRERLSGAGVEGVGGPPDRLLDVIKADMTKWGRVIKAGRIRGE